MDRTFRVLQISLLAGCCAIVAACQPASHPVPTEKIPAAATTQAAIDPTIARIRDEGLNHSHVDQTLDYLCNVIGQRLTGSPGQKQASEWTRDTLGQWGLSNAHLEPWGPFGRGWSLETFSLQVTEPKTIILDAYPKAWSPGLDGPLNATMVYLDARTRSDLTRYTGTLQGKVVLIGTVRPLDDLFKPEALRMTDDELAKLAAAPASRPRSEMLQASTSPTSGPVTRPATSRPSTFAQNAAMAFASEEFSFAAREGAAVIIDASSKGDGGTLFVQSARVPGPTSRPTSRPAGSRYGGGPSTRPNVWAVDAPAIPPQITMATEDFNRVVRMIKQGQNLKVTLNLKVKFYPPEEVNTCNTIAEIPGSDLKDQIVMVGAHLDSWHSGTGATDNGVGSACAMEAVRIIRALDLHPRRTIRVALWTGEEQGLFGSTAYVKAHFGSLPDERPGPSTRSTTRPLAELVKKPEYDQLSVYFNLDNGTGRIRGIFPLGEDSAVFPWAKIHRPNPRNLRPGEYRGSAIFSPVVAAFHQSGCVHRHAGQHRFNRSHSL